MKTLTQTIRQALIHEGKGYDAGVIHWDDPRFDPENPTVAIRGYGTMSIGFLQENIANELADLSKKTKSGQLDIVAKHFLLDEKSAFMFKVKAYMDVKQELSSSKVKRKLTLMKKRK